MLSCYSVLLQLKDMKSSTISFSFISYDLYHDTAQILHELVALFTQFTQKVRTGGSCRMVIACSSVLLKPCINFLSLLSLAISIKTLNFHVNNRELSGI